VSRFLEWAAFGTGLVLVLVSVSSLFRQLVVPRGQNSVLGLAVERLVKVLYVKGIVKVAHRAHRLEPRAHYELADRALAVAGPLTLFGLLGTWTCLLVLGYALMLLPLTEGSLADALRESGSSYFTLGFFSTPSNGAAVVDFLAAVTGLVGIALLIGYLPTLYSAFSRREALVTTLEARAGAPAWGPELLARQQLVGLLDSLGELYDDWEKWAADLAESHSNYSVLVRFRSPNPYRSWIVALLAVMDSAAMYLALAPERAPYQARLCLRMGFTALRDVAQTLRLPHNPDPRPDDPVELTYEMFLTGVQRLRDVGFPIERSPEEAWPHFRGWRVNYEDLASRLADLVDAPPAPWSGTRTHFPEVIEPIRPVDRRPDDPEGVRSRVRYPSLRR
jgi:hypothetical protein